MKFLLDTHIWVWSADDRGRLSRDVRREIANPRNELYLSPVSVWEAGLMERRGRLRARQGFSEWLNRALVQTILREAPFSLAVGEEAAAIRLPESDAGDVFIAATARVYNLTLVTTDHQLLACPWLKTMAND
jgi:PIN domain nuclease of toxin-antitoxin system